MKIKRTKQDLLDILPIGIELVDNDTDNTPESRGYYKARNDGSVVYNKDYGKMSKGKIIIYFNLNYSVSGIFAEIREDADSRKVYHGVIPNREFFIDLLTNIR